MSYTYDASGNLKTYTDARLITATYTGYDGLNRPSAKSYTKSDGTAEGTPPVSYSYDQDRRGVLSAVSVTSGGSTYRTAYTHDAFGRVATSTQTTGTGSPYVFHYQYSLADQLTRLQYPSGRTVNYTPDSLGRIAAVQNAATMSNYATVNYTPPGGVSSLALANGITEQLTWNDRLQLTGIAAGSPGNNALTLGLYPCAGPATSCATGNTGNIRTQTIAAPGLNLTQSYTYDALSRLTAAGEGSGSWSQSYGYDSIGNRWVSANSGRQSRVLHAPGAGKLRCEEPARDSDHRI